MTERATYVDLLTGAWKRDYFEAELARAVSLAQRERSPLVLLRIDVDDLQEHNDLHGQEALDEALGWLASRISMVIDGAGPIGRLGGDDFAVFMTHCPRERALRLAERLRREIPTRLHASSAGEFRLTISVGLAIARPGEPWGNLCEAAEQACLRAKQGGRDAVVPR